MQEILVLIVIALVIFYLPRLRGKKTFSQPAAEPATRRKVLAGWMRLAIMGSLLWTGGALALLEPWKREILPFLYFGLTPLILFWGAVWVWFGYRR